MSELVQACIDLIPVPFLKPVFSIFLEIWNVIDGVKTLKQQILFLAEIIAHLLSTLDRQYRSGKVVEQTTAVELKTLHRLLDDIARFISEHRSRGLLKLLYGQSETTAAIDQYHRRIAMVIHSFNIAALLSVQDWQAKHQSARSQDQQELDLTLSNLEADEPRLEQALSENENGIMDTMASITRSLDKPSESGRQRQFLEHSLKYFKTKSGRQVQIDSWTISSVEVDFGPVIGSGGFGQVYKGTWNRTPVALKTLKAASGGVPMEETIRKEIQTWANLRHPHVLQFLGANALHKEPFIVMPYLKNGNIRSHLHTNPNLDRIRILHHIALGLAHLHSQKVIHGDLKGVNVLLDDGGNAVLCDFGLSKVKADATSHSTDSGRSGKVAGSLNWMAPERIMGGSLQKPVDVYAFGMTIFEVYTLEIPLGHIPYAEFIDLVVDRDVRPQRPEEEDAPSLSDEIWDLAERCWVKEAGQRPTPAVLCDEIARIISARPPNDDNSLITSVGVNGKTVSGSLSLSLPPSPPTSSILGSSTRSQGRETRQSNIIVGGSSNETKKFIKQKKLTWVQTKNGTSHWSNASISTSNSDQSLQSTQERERQGALPLFRAKAQHDFQASPGDNHQLSFKKGEILSILDNQAKWWVARNVDDSEGIVPSNYMKVLTK